MLVIVLRMIILVTTFTDFVRILPSHHSVHALHTMNAFLTHVGTLADMQAAEFASFLQNYTHRQEQDAYCAKSQGQEREFQHLFVYLQTLSLRFGDKDSDYLQICQIKWQANSLF